MAYKFNPRTRECHLSRPVAPVASHEARQTALKQQQRQMIRRLPSLYAIHLLI